MLTLVTGCNSGKCFVGKQCRGRYVNFVIQSLKNIKEVLARTKTEARIIIYDLGMTAEQRKQLNDIDIDNIIIEDFDFDQYPDHVSLHKNYGDNCSYAWKPIIIHEVCSKYGGVVNWMDSRTHYTNFTQLYNLVKTVGIYTPKSSGNVKRWTYPTTLTYLNGEQYSKYSPRSGGIIAVNSDIPWVMSLITEWKDLALIKQCICPDGSNRRNHRQDQAILSILYYRYQEKYKFMMVNHMIDLKPWKYRE